MLNRHASQYCNLQVTNVIVIWSASWIFAFSAQTQFLNGYLIWLVLFVAALYACRVCYAFRSTESWRNQQPETPMTPFGVGIDDSEH